MPATTSRRKTAPLAADVYRIVLTMPDGSVKPLERILRPEEIDDCLALYLRHKYHTGISAEAIPCRVVEVARVAKGGA